MKIVSSIKESSELMKFAEGIAVYVQDLRETLSEEDEFDLDSKLRYCSSDIVADIANACGVLDPRDALYKLSQARGKLFEVMAVVKIAHRLGKIKLEPEVVLDIEKMVALIDAEAMKLPGAAKIWLKDAYPAIGDE